MTAKILSNAVVVVTLACAGKAHAEPSSECLNQLKVFEAERSQSQEASYRTLNASSSGIKPDNATRLSIGSRPELAVLLIHGFSASPWEAASVASELQARGYTTLSPLVTGFGGTPQLANVLAKQQSFTAWTTDTRAHFEALAACYPQVAVVGISMGASLALDLLETPSAAKISSISLVSPLIKYPGGWLTFLAGLGGLTRNTVPLADLYRFSKSRDLEVPMEFPNYYLSEMPLVALKQVGGLLDNVRDRYKKLNSPLPALIAYSEADKSVDWKYARAFHVDHFTNRTEIVLEKSRDVPHHLTVSHNGYDATPVARQISDFIQAQ